MDSQTNNGGGTGKLCLVGLGPGNTDHLTPLALAALDQAEWVVGYRAYVEQVSPLVKEKNLLAMNLGQEMERAAKAVDLAYQGASVAVISSGDTGIYGMAGPIFRVLVDRDWDGECPPLEILPGVSAMQAAAALLGAPLMQDFCSISLSDLLTPWETIRRRLEAAGQGDFVVAIYNPRSRTRDTQLREARLILLAHRTGDTPVGIVRNAYRADQGVTVTDLERLEDHLDSIDMVTVVLVGNSTTFVHRGHMVTPRGYPSRG